LVVTNGTMGLTFALCGFLLARHRPSSPIGWLFLAAGVAEATSALAVLLIGIRDLQQAPGRRQEPGYRPGQGRWPRPHRPGQLNLPRGGLC
jgi:hypothetical protein